MTTRRITTTVLGLALGGLLLAGCGTTSPASSANATTAPVGTTSASSTSASSSSTAGTAGTGTSASGTLGGSTPAPTPDPATDTQPTGTTSESTGGTTVTTAPATSLDGTWLLSGYADGTGDHAVPAGVQPKIVLGEGRIGIDAQCNAIGGNVAVTDASLTISGVISTMRACEDPQGAMERLLTSTLRGTVGYTVQDGTLTITGASATLTFTR